MTEHPLPDFSGERKPVFSFYVPSIHTWFYVFESGEVKSSNTAHEVSSVCNGLTAVIDSLLCMLEKQRSRQPQSAEDDAEYRRMLQSLEPYLQRGLQTEEGKK
jgi:hypothetical protein